tara:strand:- start:46 stop:276 length:231 start_codon:yes stop_codon:yes gene_type:complete
MQSIIEKAKRQTALLIELQNIAELESQYGVIRHHIVKQRPVMRYEMGQLYDDTGMMEVVTKDGKSHTVPAYLLETA